MFNLYGKNQPLVVSERADLTNNFDVSEREQYAALIPKGKFFSSLNSRAALISKGKFFSSLNSRKVLVLIHGFNSTVSDAMKHYEQVSKDLGPSYDQIIFYLWPGGKYGIDGLSLIEILKNTEVYSDSRDRTTHRLRLRLASFLSTLREHTSTTDIMAHSMGCRLTLEALSSIPLSTPERAVRYVYLMGAAVGRETLQVGGLYYSATLQCRDIYVFFSKKDPVLKIAFPLGECTARSFQKKIGHEVFQEAEKIPIPYAPSMEYFYDTLLSLTSEWFNKTLNHCLDNKAMGFSGPKVKDRKNEIPRNVIPMNISDEVDDHSGYYTAKVVLQTIERNTRVTV